MGPHWFVNDFYLYRMRWKPVRQWWVIALPNADLSITKLSLCRSSLIQFFLEKLSSIEITRMKGSNETSAFMAWRDHLLGDSLNSSYVGWCHTTASPLSRIGTMGCSNMSKKNQLKSLIFILFLRSYKLLNQCKQYVSLCLWRNVFQ